MHLQHAQQVDIQEKPRTLISDITAGIASSFVEQMDDKILDCKTPRQALIKAINCVSTCSYQPFPLLSDSMDLVTSSMQTGLFDQEPFKHFCELLQLHFGEELLAKQEFNLQSLKTELRDRLFCKQVDFHFKEIYRIIQKTGNAKLYYSCELFRTFADQKQYFLVPNMPHVMRAVSRYFFFEFNPASGLSKLERSSEGNTCAMNQHFILSPRDFPEVALN